MSFDTAKLRIKKPPRCAGSEMVAFWYRIGSKLVARPILLVLKYYFFCISFSKACTTSRHCRKKGSSCLLGFTLSICLAS